MPTPTILSRRGSNVRFNKGEEMTPEAQTTYRPVRFVYTRYAATIQNFLETICNFEICLKIASLLFLSNSFHLFLMMAHA